MNDQKSILCARMLGKEEITYEGESIFGSKNCTTKAVRLLLILLYNGEDGITRSRLLEELYGREEMADAANNLRVTVHRLKKILAEANLPAFEYIVLKNGIYKWNSPMKTVVDALEFQKRVAEADHEPDEDKKAEIIKEALQLYQGEFLPLLSSDEWVVIESIRLKDLYSRSLQWLCSYLKKCKEYEKILQLVEPACRIYPLDEWQSVKIDCYIELNLYEDALQEYEKTVRLLSEELGVAPSEKMMNQFREMSERISSRPRLIGEIKGGLQEEEEERGAFYCTAPSFRDAYRMMQRSMERNGQSVYLMLCTIMDGKGHCMRESEKLERMSEILHQSIKKSLRRCDTFTRYNSAQFLIMLTGINEENCNIVAHRIAEEFSSEHKSWSKRLECCVTSLYIK